jgi:hypothetical protein
LEQRRFAISCLFPQPLLSFPLLTNRYGGGMTNTNRNLMELARKFHADFPEGIRQYLNSRGIPDELIEKHLLGWNS